LLLVEHGPRGREPDSCRAHERAHATESIRSHTHVRVRFSRAEHPGPATRDPRGSQHGLRNPAIGAGSRTPGRFHFVCGDLCRRDGLRRNDNRPRESPAEPQTLTPFSLTVRGGSRGGHRERLACNRLRLRARPHPHRRDRVPTNPRWTPRVPRGRLRSLLPEGPGPDGFPLFADDRPSADVRSVRCPRPRDPRPLLRVHAAALSGAWRPRTRTSWRSRLGRTSTILSAAIPGFIFVSWLGLWACPSPSRSRRIQAIASGIRNPSPDSWPRTSSRPRTRSIRSFGSGASSGSSDEGSDRSTPDRHRMLRRSSATHSRNSLSVGPKAFN